MLTVRHLVVPCSDRGSRVLILSAATDGNIAFWDVTELLKNYLECGRHGNSESTGKMKSSEETEIDQYESEIDHKDASSFNDTFCRTSENSAVCFVTKSESEASGEIVKDVETLQEESTQPKRTKVIYQSQTMVPGRNARDVTSLGVPCHVIRAHQSGINALDIKHSHGKY